jgi:hypothetical protein
MLLHVSVCDYHQGACTWAWLKLHLLKMFGKNTSLCACSGVAAYCVKSIAMYMLSLILHYTQHIHRYGLDTVCCHTITCT